MNKIALMTGGTKGLGLAIVECFKERCDTVIATFNMALPNIEYSNVLFKKVNVKNEAFCNQFLASLGMKGLFQNLLVNNAGVVKNLIFHRMDKSTLNEVLNVDFCSIFNLTHPIYTRMRLAGLDRIINIPSVNANKGQIGQVNYCASRARVQSFTKALALEELNKNITVNTISPGYCQTDMLTSIKPEFLEHVISTSPVRGLGKPEEIVHLVSCLISDQAEYVNGANFEINGGLYST